MKRDELAALLETAVLDETGIFLRRPMEDMTDSLLATLWPVLAQVWEEGAQAGYDFGYEAGAHPVSFTGKESPNPYVDTASSTT